MCRLFCSLSTKDVSPEKMLFDSKYSIVKQAKEQGHRDGWGFASFGSGRLDFLIKQTSPLEETWGTAKHITKEHPTTCSTFFVRDASNPLALDKSSILTIDATQPFTYGNLIFMHNGLVRKPDKVMQKIENAAMQPRSKNDSEVYFILLMKLWEKHDDIKRAFVEAEKFICDVYEKNKVPEDGPDAYSSLNCIVTDGTRIYAFNRYKRQIQKGLSDSKRDFYKMAFLAADDRIIVSSEPLDEGKWQEIGDGKFLEAWLEGGKVRYSLS
jgi:predicted glutamine amidotransferase